LQPLNVSSGKSTVRFSQRNGAALTEAVYLAYDRLRKTLTSFKAARLATELDFIDKVFFVVDRKDLDYQTMKEYQRFSPDSVNGSDSTAGLKRNIDKDDNKIIVTTIQKLNNLMKGMQI
jgi:type I site-specific restriction-modification system R (restriction) subunit